MALSMSGAIVSAATASGATVEGRRFSAA